MNTASQATTVPDHAADCLAQLAPVRKRLLAHPIYESITSLRRVQIFMEHHVFAVWDFMSLLKRLQQVVTSVSVPWLPPARADLSRFINEIVLGEESDADGRGGYASHFELYLEAMRECGANPAKIEAFLLRLQQGADVQTALHNTPLAEAVRKFVLTNLQLAISGEPHQVAAAFFFGREDVIPEMFARVSPRLAEQGGRVERLRYYVDRHIELDAEEHGPLARRLLEVLCADNPNRWREATQTAIEALECRIELWNATLAALMSQPA